jgi:hypothetical protein
MGQSLLTSAMKVQTSGVEDQTTDKKMFSPSATTKTQPGTLTKAAFSQNSNEQNDSSVLAVLQNYRFYLLASAIVLLLLTCLLCYFINRRRKGYKDTTTVTSRAESDMTFDTSTRSQTSMSSRYSKSEPSSILRSDFSQDQTISTISVTLASKELGSYPSLNIFYNLSWLIYYM